MSDQNSQPDILIVTDGPAVIQLVVPIMAEENIVLNEIMTDNATVRSEQPQ